MRTLKNIFGAAILVAFTLTFGWPTTGLAENPAQQPVAFGENASPPTIVVPVVPPTVPIDVSMLTNVTKLVSHAFKNVGHVRAEIKSAVMADNYERTTEFSSPTR